MIAFNFTATEFLQATSRLQDGLKDFRSFWKHYQDKGQMAEIQTEWFYSGGPDPVPLKKRTIQRRRLGVFLTERKSSDFYRALKTGSQPGGPVGSARPKWVWTKNTLRSTYKDPKETRNSLVFDTGKFDRITQKRYYSKFNGPFAKYMPKAKRIWNLPRIREDVAKHLGIYFTALIGRRAA